MNEYNDFYQHLLSTERDKNFQEEMNQIRVKALLGDIAEEIPPYDWSYISRRVVRNMSFILFELESIAKNDPSLIDGLSTVALENARTWEALAKLREATTSEIALVNAAVNYELANYQANATCLARKISNNKPRSKTSLLLEMSTLFLQRRILQLKNLAKSVQVEPLVKEEKITNSLFESMALALAGRAFSMLARYLLGGDRILLEKSLDAFQNSGRLFVSLGFVEEANLVASVSCLLPIIDRRTTWTLLSSVASHNIKWQRYLRLLARGLGTNIYASRSISELWPSQVMAIQKGLFHESLYKIIKMPTSAGKTRIAEMAIVHTLVNYPGAKCVYIAPYRSLVSELEQSFLYLFSDLGYRISSITGNYESDDFEELLFRDTDIVVTTPEKLDMLLRSHPEYIDNIRLFVVDEVHIIQDKQRGLKFELLLTRLKQKFVHARFLLLSAVISQQTLEDFITWFKASSQTDLIDSTWRPSVQRSALFESATRSAKPSVWYSSVQQSSMFDSVEEIGVLQYAREGDMQLYRGSEPPTVFRQQTYRYTNRSTRRINEEIFPDMANKAQIAAELVFNLVKLGPVFVFCTTTTYVTAVANALQRRLSLASRTDQDVPSCFNKDKPLRSALLARDWVGNQQVISWLESKIGVHYGSLPDVVRKAVETDFRQRNLSVLIATNTLAQGVNLPVRTVIIHSCRRYDNNDNTTNRISARDYWNIAGRAGRAGEETEGFVIHIKVNDDDKKDYEYYLRKKEKVEDIDSVLYQRLTDLIENRISETAREDIRTQLDAEILALLIEESTDNTLEDIIHKTIDNSLMKVKIDKNSKYPAEKLYEIFLEIAKEVANRANGLEIRKLYSSTGFCSISCLKLYDHINRNEDVIRELFTYNHEKSLNEIIQFLLPICLELHEMLPKRDLSFGGNYSDLLIQWVRGTDIGDLMVEFQDQVVSNEGLGKIIDVLFRGLLPWGISAYLRVARQILDLKDSELSDSIKFLPSMVKFGLPDPMACWAMSVGIPFRRAAIEIAAAFRSQIQEPNYYKFLRWLNGLDSERLLYDFGLTDIILEDVSRAINISSINTLLREFTSLSNFLPRTVFLSGIKYHNRYNVVLRAKIGEKVEIVRDYKNEVDHNAIIFLLSGEEIGYIPRDVAQVLAPEMDSGIELDATIVSLTFGQFPRVSIRISQKT